MPVLLGFFSDNSPILSYFAVSSYLRRAPGPPYRDRGQCLVLNCRGRFCAPFSFVPSACLSCLEVLSCPLGSYVKCSASLPVRLACFFSLPVPLGFQFQTWYPSGVTLSSGAKRDAFQIEHKCASRAGSPHSV